MPSDIVLQFGLWDSLVSNVNVFLALMILFGTIIAGLSAKASVAGFGGFLVFTKIATETDIFIWRGALYLVMGVLLVVTGVRLIGFATSGELD